MPELADVCIQPDHDLLKGSGITNTGKKDLRIFKIGTDIDSGQSDHTEIMILYVPLYQAGQFSLDEVSNPAAAAEFFSHGLRQRVRATSTRSNTSIRSPGRTLL